MHVYLPLTPSALAAVVAQQQVAPAPLDGYAVTAGLREQLAGESDEELEYAAQNLAAAASLARLPGDPGAARRRVVLVVDVADAALDDPDGLAVGSVVLREAVPFARVVSVLVDDPSAESYVARAVAEVDDADALADLDDHALLWFAAQELPEIVAELV